MSIVCVHYVLHFLNQTMREEGKSEATITKYQRDIRDFLLYLIREDASCRGCPGDRASCRLLCGGEGQRSLQEPIRNYREELGRRYAAVSANSKLAAVKYYLKCIGFPDFPVKFFRMQNTRFRSLEKELTKEEYFRLLQIARNRGKQRLYMLMQTLAATGIRISELRFVTAESVAARRIQVTLKGKSRDVLLTGELCRRLERYMQEQGIREGPVFVTRSGKPVDRSNVIHEMKQLCEEAGVRREKVFPHNLRHLFAVTYYNSEKDIFHLADILGHANINTTRIYTSIGYGEHMKRIENLGLLHETLN